jgi:matrix metalloproteinase-14 (membrane-inserted)
VAEYPIQGSWPGLAEAIPVYNAAVAWNNGFAYFFMGKSYVKYNMDPAHEGVVAGPLPIKGNWPGLAEAFPSGIDAAVVWNNGYAYFFKGNKYVRYNMDPAQEGVVGTPLLIKGHWPGLAEKFPNGIDTVVAWNNGYAYFFKGTRYVRYNMDPAHEGVVGGTVPIRGNWHGLAEAFFLP